VLGLVFHQVAVVPVETFDLRHYYNIRRALECTYICMYVWGLLYTF
jgi:hypothetical protein